jgi:hypothetical protein
VLVCPGTYPEQVTISQPLTLQGITSANSAQAVIAVPGGGMSSTPDSVLAQRTRKNGAPPAQVVQARSKASANRLCSVVIPFHSNCCGRWRLPSFARLGRARAPVSPLTDWLAHRFFDF